MPEQKVSPAVVIAGGLLLGVGAAAAVGLFALARAAPGKGAIGDLNDDGLLDQPDLVILQEYLLGGPISEISPLDEAEFLRRADVNGDGVVDDLDLTALVNIILPPEGYTCPVCGNLFSTLGNLQYHFTNSHPREEIPIDWQ